MSLSQLKTRLSINDIRTVIKRVNLLSRKGTCL
jgi:hypothetical protein